MFLSRLRKASVRPTSCDRFSDGGIEPSTGTDGMHKGVTSHVQCSSAACPDTRRNRRGVCRDGRHCRVQRRVTQSPNALVSAAQSEVRPVDTPRLKGSDPATSYASIVEAVAPAVVTVRVEKKASIVPTQSPDDDDSASSAASFRVSRASPASRVWDRVC